MGAFFVYILKTSICLVFFYLFYRLLLSRETFHRFNRIALLVILLLSCLLPLIEVTVEQKNEMQQTMLTLEQLLLMADVPQLVVDVPQQHTVNGIQVSLMVYLAGILFFFCRHLYSLVHMIGLLRKGTIEKLENGVRLIVLDKEVAPFSWMRYIVISRKDLEENGRAILMHEQAHIDRRHSLDLLLADICIFFQWFNPAAWLLKQELQNIHEYEADESVIKQGIDAKQYQLLLIKKAVGTRLYSMANSLNHSKLKKRITMMLKEKSSPWARLKYLYVLPLAAVTVTVFARPEISEKAEEISAVKVNDLTAIVETKLTETIAVDSVKPKNFAPTPPQVVFETVDEMPVFPGGSSELMAYLAKNIRYPVLAQEAGTEGRVIVQFVIGADGKVTSPKVVRSIQKDLDAEAIRLCKNMPVWQPGKHNGKAVAVRYTVPILFKLQPSKLNDNSTPADNEVVVVGYGPSEKKSAPATSEDGAMHIRTTGENVPLIIVNGEETKAVSDIKPDKIKEISVLKDATATQMYGEKGKNGVVFITLFTDTELAAKAKDKQVKAPVTLDGMKVSGKVVDQQGKPIVGASILVEGTTTGTITDTNGEFTLIAPQESTLAIAFIDKGTAKVKVSDKPIQVILKSE